MTKIITFLRTLLLSAVSPAYYADVLKAKLSFSVKYFFVLVVIMTVVMVGKILAPISLFNLPMAADRVVESFPSDLEVQLQGGKVSINQPLPYMVPMPRGDRPDEDSQYQSLVVFDTNDDVHGARDFMMRKTLFLVTEDTVWMRQGRDAEIRTYPIPADAEDVSLSSRTLQQMKNAFLNLPAVRNKWYVPAAGVILFLVVLPIMIIGQVIGTAIHAAITYFLTKILKKYITHGVDLPFAKIWQVVLHATTTMVVLRFAADLVRFPRHNILTGGSGTLLMVLWVCICLYAATSGKKLSSPLGMVPSTAARPARKVSRKKVTSRRK